MIEVGQKAPDFKLPDTDKNEVTLDSFKGKNLVVFFFPMAWTGVCTKEMCSVQEDYKVYNSLNAAVIGVSVDSHLALKKFKEENKIEYPLLSDFNKTTIHDFDIVQPVFSAVYKNVAKRATIIIDKNGIVRYIQVTPTPGDLPEMEPIKAALKAIS
jgi:glutaredoxin-dependent peroxiredoxin